MQRKRGTGLIEIVLAIVIGIGLITGGVILYTQSATTLDFRDASREMVNIATQTRTAYAAQAKFTGVSTDTLIDMNAIRPGIVTIEGTDRSARIYGDGNLEYAPHGSGDRNFQVDVNFGQDALKVRSICNRLTAANDQNGVGPLGNGYIVTSKSCNDVAAPRFSVVYSADGGTPEL